MARNLSQGDRVFVPRSRFDVFGDFKTAFYETKITQTRNKSVKVNLPGGINSEWIGKSIVRKNVGTLIVNIGDFETERTLLDPLAKSILQFGRLLIPDDILLSLKLRSLDELKKFWDIHHKVYSYIIFIGHGNQKGIKFGSDGWIKTDEMEDIFYKWGEAKKDFISLCCKTGYKSYGSKFSTILNCNSFIAPFHSVHGAVASQFCQTLLTTHLLEGKSINVSFKNARSSVPGATSFRLWKKGSLKAGKKI